MEMYLGQILLVPFNFTPKGWALCNGQLLPIAGNQALYALLGPQFGGDGKTNFAVPKLAAPAAGLTYLIATQGVFPQRD